ncbi:hypothetical protein MLD38_010793 [Melastoma candidum]|uniref:Uncharacterized protein n=1 Tax=Melastoma candidum TaxID=119954 RepID=A0ACB9R114_9MYRT|nr:hypothetical protein MLD38_010793 [Melastoma candidum]
MQLSSSSSSLSLPLFSSSSTLPRTPPLSSSVRIPPLMTPAVQGRSFVIGLGRRRRSHRSKNKGLTCNALFGLGVPELVVIAGVAALVFGPKKLPEVGRSIGKTVKSFQQAAKEFESELKKEPETASGSGSAVDEPKQVTEAKEDEKVGSTKESV